MGFSSFPTAVDVTLHRYNHLDNRLWTQIKNDLDYVEVDDKSLVVSRGQIMAILESNYNQMIHQIKATGTDSLYKKVTSPYFIYMMCNDMPNMQLVKFTLSHDKKFTRLIESESGKVLKFDFKVLAMTIRLSEIFEKEELDIINKILEDLKILEEEIPYSRLRIVDLLDTLDDWIETEIDRELDEGEEDPVPLITAVMDLIDMKTEGDNPITLIITDY